MLSSFYKERVSEYYNLFDSSVSIDIDLIKKSELSSDFFKSYDAGFDRFFNDMQIHLHHAFDTFKDNLIGSAILVGKKTDMVVKINAAFELKNRLVYAQTHKMDTITPAWNDILTSLPVPLRCFYTHYNGMHTSWSETNMLPFGSAPKNLPCGIFSWDTLELYRQDNRLQRKKFAFIEKQIGDLNELLIWIDTDWGDLIIVNYETKDQRLYHVKNRQFDDFIELTNPVDTIDRYCAHVFSGEKEAFYFRK